MVRWTWVVFVALIAPAVAAAKTPVRFVFEIGECASSTDPARCHPYGAQFDPADLAWIHKTVSTEIRKVLSTELPPFDFASTAPEQYVLRARLMDGPITTGPTAIFSLSVGDAEAMEIEYRDSLHYGQPILEKEVFAAELIARLSSEIKRRRREVVQKLLSKLPLSEGALPLPQQKMFVLKFAEDELKIGKDSRLRIETVDSLQQWDFVALAMGPAQAGLELPEEFRLKIVAIVVEPQDSITRLQSGGPLTGKTIYLLHWEPPPPRLQPATNVGG